MGKLYYLRELPPVEYTISVRHHYNGTIEVTIDGVGDSVEDRAKIADTILEAAILVANKEVTL